MAEEGPTPTEPEHIIPSHSRRGCKAVIPAARESVTASAVEEMKEGRKKRRYCGGRICDTAAAAAAEAIDGRETGGTVAAVDEAMAVLPRRRKWIHSCNNTHEEEGEDDETAPRKVHHVHVTAEEEDDSTVAEEGNPHSRCNCRHDDRDGREEEADENELAAAEYFTRTFFIVVMVELRWLVEGVHDILLNHTAEGICYVFLLLQLIAVKIIGKRCEAEAEK